MWVAASGTLDLQRSSLFWILFSVSVSFNLLEECIRCWASVLHLGIRPTQLIKLQHGLPWGTALFSWRSNLSHFSALCQWMRPLLYWRKCIGVHEPHFLILAWGHQLSNPYSAVFALYLHYSCRWCCRGFGCINWRAGFGVLRIHS